MIRFARLGLLVIVVATLAASGCNGIGPSRTASGKAASKRLDASGVTRLDIANGFGVRVTLGQPEAVTVSYDDNLADLLDVGVDGRTLRLQLKPHGTITNRPTLRAEVTVGQLEEVRVAGGSTVDIADPVPNPGLRLQVSGGSRVTADLGLDRADATVSGGSHLSSPAPPTRSRPMAPARATSSWPSSAYITWTSGSPVPATPTSRRTRRLRHSCRARRV